MRLLGLDEAGRGCVLGPLVVGAFLWESEGPAGGRPAEQQPLREAGADDSKAMSAAARERVREQLRPLGQGRVIQISAATIDQGNINTLEEDAFFQHIVETSPDLVFIDAPVHPRGIPAFQARLAARVAARGLRPRFVIEPKADATWPVVGAASIFAKVARDAEIATLGPVGSGYPSDPVTRAWLSGFLERGDALPDCVRSRWGTLDVLRQQRLFASP